VLSIGLALIRVPHTFIGQVLTGSKADILAAIDIENGWQSVLGACLSVFIVVAAAVRSVWTETVLKRESRAVVAQVRLQSRTEAARVMLIVASFGFTGTTSFALASWPCPGTAHRQARAQAEMV